MFVELSENMAIRNEIFHRTRNEQMVFETIIPPGYTSVLCRLRFFRSHLWIPDQVSPIQDARKPNLEILHYFVQSTEALLCLIDDV